jgi:transposase
MLANVQQTTIRPIIEGVVAPGSCIHTDEYSIYARLTAWGYEHKTVCHGRGEYARDEDGDGFCITVFRFHRVPRRFPLSC